MGAGRVALARQIADGDNGGRLRAAADNRGQQHANCKKIYKKKISSSIRYNTVPSSGTVPEPYRISIDPESIQYCNNNPYTYMYSTQFITPY